MPRMISFYGAELQIGSELDVQVYTFALLLTVAIILLHLGLSNLAE